MKSNTYKLKSEVLLYPGMAGWHFIYLPKKEAAIIRKQFASIHRGWGSLPVLVTLGKTSWRTSIFFDKRSDTYLLPLKALVRKKEGIFAKDKVSFSIEIQV
ncbi:MAG: DUF1905 domain-containing protein [Patescibacteria group bacterium]